LENKNVSICRIFYILENAENKTYTEIGEDIGFSRQTISNYVKDYKDTFLEDIISKDSEMEMDNLGKIDHKIHLKVKRYLDKFF